MEKRTDKNDANLAGTATDNFNFKENFDRNLVEYDEQRQGPHRKAWTSERIIKVISDIKKAQVTTNSGQRKTSMDYYWMKKYEVVTTENEDHLIFKRPSATAPTIRVLPREQYFDVLLNIHKSCGHGGRDKILYDIKNKYYIPKKAVEIFVSLCPICETKRNAPRNGIGMKSNVTRDFNLRGQIEIMDFQSCPDGEFKWLLNYQDNATKFLNLRPLKTKKASEVATELMKIFLIFGAPCILQSDRSNEFTANVIKELVTMWPECKIDHRNPPTQGSVERSNQDVERSNQDVESMLQAWMNVNKSTKWSVGCFFVQYFKNASIHQKIGLSPYKALFGSDPKPALNGSDIPTSTLSTTETEEQLKTFTVQESAEATNRDYDSSDNNNDSKTLLNTENVESNFTCSVCHNDVTGAYKCEFCKSTVHTTCEITVSEESYGSKNLGVVYKVERDIKVEKDEEHDGLKRAAEKMTDDSASKMPKLDIGNSVLLSVPKTERSEHEKYS